MGYEQMIPLNTFNTSYRVHFFEGSGGGGDVPWVFSPDGLYLGDQDSWMHGGTCTLCGMRTAKGVLNVCLGISTENVPEKQLTSCQGCVGGPGCEYDECAPVRCSYIK